MTQIADMAEFRIQKREATVAEFRQAVGIQRLLLWAAPKITRAFTVLADALMGITLAVIETAEKVAAALQSLSSSAGQTKPATIHQFPGVDAGFPRRGATR